MEKHIIGVQFTLEMFNQTTTVNPLIVYQFTFSCHYFTFVWMCAN